MFRVAVLQTAAVDRGDVPLGTSAQADEWELIWGRMSQNKCAFAHRSNKDIADLAGLPETGSVMAR